MGEVYRARDTRLGREVAIKVLPQCLSANPDLKARFEREAKAISVLNHPHICHLYDVGSERGTDFLVMELLEGESLANGLQRGPLVLQQALEIAIEIAEALDKAHKSGIVHRDLKPGNIMLTKSGAKLLDFGLAKPAAEVTAAASGSMATMIEPLTGEGKIVGTYQYMAPEQLHGKAIDARTDIFALGSVLYEMVTGKRAFQGQSQISVMSAILEKDPEPVSSLRPLTPPALDHVIKRALAKDPDQRWQSASDLALELKWLSESSASSAIPAATRLRPANRIWALAAALAASLFAAFFAYTAYHKAPAESAVIRSAILPPEGGDFVFNGPVGGAFLSPDGSAVAFIARVGKVTQLWVRPLDSFSAHALPGTEDTGFAFWSPDSRNLGFFAQGKLKRVPVTGGPPLVICDADSLRGASWSRKDVIIFSRVTGGIQSVPASGGAPQTITTLDVSRREGTHRWPFFLPDGNHFLFMAASLGPVSEENVFYLGSLDGKPPRVLFHGSSPILYASGHVLYVSGNVLMARPFDPGKLDLTGDGVPLAEKIQTDPLFSNAMFSVSEKGALLYQKWEGGLAHSLLLFDRSGKRLRDLGPTAPVSAPRFSPDGKSIAYDFISTDAGKQELWIQDIDSGNRTRLVSDSLNIIAHSPVWSPDGTRLAYAAIRNGNRVIFIKSVNQISAEQERWDASTNSFAFYIAATDWTPDGKWLVLTERPMSIGQRVSLLSVQGKEGTVPLLEVKDAAVNSGEVSPDGRWMAYASDESGKLEIYVTSFPKPAGKLQVSTAGGVTPRWRRDGKELYYVAPDKNLMVAELKESAGSLEVVSTRPLFEVPQVLYLTAAGVSQYDVTRDGNLFAVDSVNSESSSTPLSLVLNWPAEHRK
jgi:Tol biopolymer transport system component